MMHRRILPILFLLLASTLLRAEERFPAPEFRSDYEIPEIQTTPAPSSLQGHVDVLVLLGALSLATWLVIRKRSRRGVFFLTIASLLYFGFYRKGCVCAIGSIQNVALSAGGHGYALPWVVAAFFILPLLFSLFFGRVFCSSVCPLGAIQDVVLWRPVHLPGWLELSLGLLAYAYLGLAVMLAAIGSDFLICRYDPFVGFFRMSGPAHMLIAGGVLLLISMFVGRVYCRFLCPYSVLLCLLSPFSRHRVSITPQQCVDCRLCEQSCPFGAIRYPTPRQTKRGRDSGRRHLVWAIALLPVLIALFALLGRLGGPALSRLDFTVTLAERVWLEEHGLVDDITDASKAFRELGDSPESLYARASDVQRKFAIGGGFFGAWMGIVIGLKLIGLVIRRTRTDYTADPAGCVACARCYASCPIEQELQRERQEERELVAV